MIGIVTGLVLVLTLNSVSVQCWIPRGSQILFVLPNYTAKCPKKWTDVNKKHTMCLTDAPGATRVLLESKERQWIVDTHNEIRANVTPKAAAMPALVWDRRLAEVASKLTMQCKFGHDAWGARQIPGYQGISVGQNTAAGQPDFESAIRTWYNENKYWRYGMPWNPKYGHYLQQIHARTTRIGCGMAKCAGASYSTFFVCNYAKSLVRGNPYGSAKVSCKKCPDKCVKNLCDCKGRLCYNGKRLNPTTCKCECGKLFRGDQCQNKNCPGMEENWCSNTLDCTNTFYIGYCTKTCKWCP
ncbi:cysteine-rich venom protein Mr30-like [Littorina saxatilis]|uniref:SCP domain-containing protein n=1 Tax=Littorina saxatilis TaxID=31220 RepID=A0AAN9G487_9CAEN